MIRPILLTVACAAASWCSAQVNEPGTVQVGVGGELGFFATHFVSEMTVPFLGHKTSSHDDGAVTTSLPIDLQVGVARRWSIGISLDPGRYVDSAGTQPNAFLVAGLQPRFYAVIGDHFALHLNAEVGYGVLKIRSNENTNGQFEDTYAGMHVRVGTEAQVYFGRVFGLHAGLKYALHGMEWKRRDPENDLLDLLDYKARLRTSGLLVQLGLQVRF